MEDGGTGLRLLYAANRAEVAFKTWNENVIAPHHNMVEVHVLEIRIRMHHVPFKVVQVCIVVYCISFYYIISTNKQADIENIMHSSPIGLASVIVRKIMIWNTDT